MFSADHIAALQVLADVYVGQGRATQAVTLLEAGHALAPQEATVIKALSYACLVAGDYERALVAVEAFLELDDAADGNAPILLIRSRALWALGREAAAVESLREYRQLSGTP